MPVEIMLLPRWFPFHLDKISYWARTVIVPLLVLTALKPRARNPRGVGIDELFCDAAADRRRWREGRRIRIRLVRHSFARRSMPSCVWPSRCFPKGFAPAAHRQAVAFVTERLNGEDGLGAIFPAMANSVMMFDALGYRRSHPDRAIAAPVGREAARRRCDEAYCQPCVSPVWDTGSGLPRAARSRRARRADRAACAAWMAAAAAGPRRPRRLDRSSGRTCAPAAGPSNMPIRIIPISTTPPSSSWRWIASQRQAGAAGLPRRPIERGREWIVGMQSRNGGWGAFDADNDYYYLNNIPFADHGALLDPPTEDVTARCVSHARPARRARSKQCGRMARALAYLRRDPARGRKLVRPLGHELHLRHLVGAVRAQRRRRRSGAPEMRKAVDWLVAIQNDDGGWGEDGASYKLDYHGYERAPSHGVTDGVGAARPDGGRRSRSSGRRARHRLSRATQQAADGFWNEPRYTATGFPRVFYLRYHGYAKFFPLWAMARYRNLKSANTRAVGYGM